ncbi:MAG TPA: chloride channel protein, partial [Thermomicrobiales bacterium]|nr:chloride channel protein [Thermomicrobiales bacterium]
MNLRSLLSNVRGQRRIAFGIDNGRYLLKWIALAVLIGSVAGLGAILLDVAIRVASELGLGRLVGAYPPLPAGEGASAIQEIERPWVLPLLVGFGVFLSGLIVRRFAHETAGGGQDAVIESYHYNAGQIRGRVWPVKLVASAITIGFGGSAGREGPAAQVSAAFGSVIARVFRLSVNERRICVIVGVAAGIGAIFRAPLGGAVLACEILYRQDFESDAIIPALIASIVSFSLFSTYGGWSPLFGMHPDLVFNQPVQLIYFAVLGVLAGVMGIVYARSYYGMERMFRRMRVPELAKPAIGGALVGLIAIAVPQVLESGYGWVQIAMDERVFEIPLWILLLLPLLKILATGLTVGSGASGGIFGPGIVVGAMLGAGFWRVFHDVLPSMPDSPASFTIIAMIAHFGSIAHVPLAVMIMVAEMTGNLSLLAPAMVAVGIATFVVGNETMFRSQPVSQADSPVHRYQYAFPLLASLSVAEAMKPAHVTVQPDTQLDDAEAQMHAAGVTGAPVVNADDKIAGILLGSAIALIPEETRPRHIVSDVLAPVETWLDPSASLDLALDTIASGGLSWVPVVHAQEYRLEGIIAVDDILRAYRAALARSARRTTSLATGSTLLELNVNQGSPLLGRALRDLKLPEDALIVSRARNGVVTFPHGDTMFRPGDVVTVVT